MSFEDYFRERVADLDGESALGAGPAVTVQKMAAYVPVSNELLADMGLIPWVWNKPTPLPWRTRFAWWRSAKRRRIGELAYRLITGEPVPGDDSWD